MDINKLHSPKRTGKLQNYEGGARTEYQRDFDRLIFSSAFRRLQNKTQVFPLPGSTFVHNRLTHSLEVSSIGRSLGKIVGTEIFNKYKSDLTEDSKEFYKYELHQVIAAACLAHDMGNPAFGHSGEKAISNYFITSGIDKTKFSDKEWKDLTEFEGNANAFRLLTNQFNGRLQGGLRITKSTLATILKYPCESEGVDKSYSHRKKYGFFQSEKDIFIQVMDELGVNREQAIPLCYCRHPFVYLLEAADDIAYNIIDFEDAHRINILDTKTVIDEFIALIRAISRREDNIPEIERTVTMIIDENEKIAYLRSKAINALILEAADTFMKSIEFILDGKYNNTLIAEIESQKKALSRINKISIERIYNHNTVVELELAGYNVMNELLNLMIPPALRQKGDRTPLDKKALELVPAQFGEFNDSATAYEKAMGIVDYVSGMTDLYATELYRKIKGIEIGKHK